MKDHDRIIKRLETIAKLGEEEKSALRLLPLRQKTFAENSDLIHRAIERPNAA